MKEGILVNVRHSTTPKGEKRTDRDRSYQWKSIEWVRSYVNRLQIWIAKAIREGIFTSHIVARKTGWEMLERSAAKVARSVLRGLGVGNDSRLLDRLANGVSLYERRQTY
ncbi:MAG: hypothetical protein ACT6FG_08045 [Methanosarcinaceae archaeon]